MFFTSSVRCGSVQEAELLLTCSVWFGQNSKTLLRSVTNVVNLFSKVWNEKASITFVIDKRAYKMF